MKDEIIIERQKWSDGGSDGWMDGWMERGGTEVGTSIPC